MLQSYVNNLDELVQRRVERGMPNVAAFFKEQHVPGTVLVEIGNVVETFLRDTSNMNDHDYGIVFTINQIIMYIAEYGVSDIGIEALGDDIRRLYRYNPELFDGEGMIRASKQLARSIRDTFYQQGLYTKEGLLPYMFEGWLDKQFTVMILKASIHQH